MLEKIAKGLHDGNGEMSPINKELYDKYTALFKQGLNASFKPGKGGINIPMADAMLQSLRTNIFKFSGAKTLAEMAQMRALLIDENGKQKPWPQYRNDVLALDAEYNTRYLKTEYYTATHMARMIGQYLDAMADDAVKFFTWQAVEDEKTCPICGPLDGICLPKDDPFWEAFWPLLHFLCRCRVIQSVSEHKSARITDSEAAHRAAKESKISDAFKGNAALTGEVFDENHPYLQGEDMNKLDAVKTYGMPTLETIADKLPEEKVPDAWPDSAFEDKYKEMVSRGETLMDTPNGPVTIDEHFDHYVFNDKPAGTPELLNVLETPDEVWNTVTMKGKEVAAITSYYISFYNDSAIAVEVETDMDKGTLLTKKIIAGAMTSKSDINKLRKGILMFSK